MKLRELLEETVTPFGEIAHLAAKAFGKDKAGAKEYLKRVKNTPQSLQKAKIELSKKIKQDRTARRANRNKPTPELKKEAGMM